MTFHQIILFWNKLEIFIADIFFFTKMIIITIKETVVVW